MSAPGRENDSQYHVNPSTGYSSYIYINTSLAEAIAIRVAHIEKVNLNNLFKKKWKMMKRKKK